MIGSIILARVRTFVFGGPPSAGKSRVIRALLAVSSARADGWGRTGVAKLDCQESPDAARFTAAGIPALGLAAGRFCPDHALLEALPGVRAWAAGEGLATLVIETAGLCDRCAPFLARALAVFVV